MEYTSHLTVLKNAYYKPHRKIERLDATMRCSGGTPGRINYGTWHDRSIRLCNRNRRSR